MDEKEAEARPVMGTIFLVSLIWPMSDRTYKMQAVISPNSNFARRL